MFRSLKRLSSLPRQGSGRGDTSPTEATGKGEVTPLDVALAALAADRGDSKSPPPTPTPSTNYHLVPVRLLLVHEFYKFADDGSVPFFELVPSTAFVEVSIEDFLSKYATETAAISWRWEAKKPNTQKEAESRLKTEANPCHVRIIQNVRHRLEGEDGIKFIWIDWCCAPQFGLSPIPEVSRSGLYFQHAKRVLFCCYESDTDEVFSCSDYFTRTWTLAERLYRSKSPDQPLRTKDLLPQTLIESFFRLDMKGEERKPLMVDTGGSPWGVLMASAMAKLRLSTSANSQGGLIPEVVKEFVAETVCGRYPLLSKSLALVEASDSVWGQVLSPVTLSALSLALRLRAIGEWARFPDPSDDVCQVVQFSPRDLKTFIFEITLQKGKSAVAVHASAQALVNALDEMLTLEDVFRIDYEKGLEIFDANLINVFRLILDELAKEKPSKGWLRQYLLHSSANFEASFEPDKVFSIYKLFDLPDRSSYEDVEYVWRDMARLARLDRMHSEVFGWVRDLSMAPLHPQDDVLSFFFAENKRLRPDLSSFDPRNFGVFAFPPLFCRQQLTMETLLLHADVANHLQTLSYLVGFNLDERAAAKLSKKNDYKLVANVPDDLEPYSLDERSMISFTETHLHELVRRCFSLTKNGDPFVTKSNNGLFILMRYHGVSQVCHVLVMRTACYSQEQWALECIGGFSTPHPISAKSSKPVALILEKFMADILSLESDLGIEYCVKHNGTSAPFADAVFIVEDVNLSNTGKAKKSEGFVNLWELNGDYNPDRGESTFHGGLLLKKHSMDVGDLVVFGKTTFDAKTEFNRLQKASQLIAVDGGSVDALAKYYHLLQRNYVHDTIMAQRIGYFGELCSILALHIDTLPVLLEDGDIRQSVDYFCEDMSDALSMATAEPAVVEKARIALDKLSQLLRD